MCLLSRDGSMLWVDEHKARRIQEDLENKRIHGHFRIEGRTLNTVEITGVYYPQDIEDMTRRKNGQWKCLSEEWHDRNQKCECIDIKTKKIIVDREKAIEKCKKCVNGWLVGTDLAYICDCQKNILWCKAEKNIDCA